MSSSVHLSLNLHSRLFGPPTLFSFYVTGVATALFILLGFVSKRRLGRFPPGPRSLFGVLTTFRHFLVTNHIYLLPGAKYYVEKYGKIMGFVSYFRRAVVISDAGLLKEAFSSPAVSSRSHLEFLQMYEDGKYRGIATTNAGAWKEIRRFTMTQLRAYGAGQKSLDPVISTEAEELMTEMRKNVDKPFSTRYFFNLPAFNILWQLISSQRFQSDDPQAQRLVKGIEQASEAWMQAVVMSIHLKLGKWLLRILGIKNHFVAFHKQFLPFSSSFVQARKADFDRGIRQDDLTDAFLSKIETTTDVKSQFYGQLGYENLNEVIRDVFIGGTETSAATLSWALLYLALHPEKQAKLQAEIDSVLEGRTPTLHDKPKLVYLEAVVQETLRKSCAVPLSVPHATTERISLGKYTLPKGTTVIANTWAIHHCEETWGDPYAFRPERFLSEDESTLVKHDAFVPFSFGRRACPGEQLARHEIFVFLVNIFREFSVAPNPAEPKPQMGTKLSWGLAPQPHTLIITQRKLPFL